MSMRHFVSLFQNERQAYINKVLATSPIAYWQLNEGAGTTIEDSSGNSYNGSYTGVTWDGTKFVKGGPVPFLDGSTDVGDVYSAAFASAFDMDEGCLLIWAKVANAGVWTDATFRKMIAFRRDIDNRVQVGRQSSDNTLLPFREGNNTQDFVGITTSTTDWFSILWSWSVANDEGKAFLGGVQVGATQTGLIASAGSGLSSTNTTLGAVSTTPTEVWHGYLAHAAVWDRPADAAIIALGT